MKIEYWPIYVTDTGTIFCDFDNCIEEYEFSEIGRRTNIGELIKALKQHSITVHGIELE